MDIAIISDFPPASGLLNQRRRSALFPANFAAPGRVCADSRAGERRTTARKGKRVTKLIRAGMRKPGPVEPAQPVQRKQKCGLKAVACADRIDRFDRGCIDLDGSGLWMPRLGTFYSARDREQAAASGKKRSGLVRITHSTIKIVEIDVGHPDDVGAVGKLAHLAEIGLLVLDQIGPAIRVERYRC